jgi:hypothetical protein
MEYIFFLFFLQFTTNIITEKSSFFFETDSNERLRV